MNEAPHPLMALIHWRNRGASANYFFRALRDEPETDATNLYWTVVERLASRVSEADLRGRDDYTARYLYQLLSTRRDLGIDFARTCIAREALPPEARAEQKAAVADAGRRSAMAEKPATLRQIAYLREMGFQGEIPNRLEASNLIDRFRRGTS